MFGSVFASFPPLRTEKPPAILHFLPVFSSFFPHFLCFVLNFPFVVRAQSNRRRGVAEHHAHACLCALQVQSPIPLRRIVHVKLFFAPSSSSKCTLPPMEKAQGKGHECPPSFRELPRSVVISEPYYFSFPCDICVDCASCVLLRLSFYDTDRK